MIVLNSSFEDEDDDDDCDFLSEDEDGLMNDGRVVLENIEEEDEEESVVDAEEVFPSRAPAEIVWDDRGGFSGGVVAQGETEDDTGEDGETEDSTDSEEESSDLVETYRTNYVEGEWTGPEDRMEPISIESVVTVIGREDDAEEESNTYLAEGNKMSAMEFLLFQTSSEDNTTFIGLEADHDPAEEVCLGSKETLPSPENEDAEHLVEEKSSSPIEQIEDRKEIWSVSEKEVAENEVTNEESNVCEDDGESTEEETGGLQEIHDTDKNDNREHEENERSKEEEDKEEEEEEREEEEKEEEGE